MVFASKADVDDLTQEPAVEGRSLWQDARARFLQNKAAVGGLIVLCLVGVFALFGSQIAAWSNEDVDWAVLGNVETMGMPSIETGHYFGTDELGRDLFARTVQGTQISLMVGIVGAFIAGRELITSANGEALTAEQLAQLQAHAKTIDDEWERVLAEATFKYAGSVYKDIAKLQDAEGDAAVQVPALHRERDDEPAKKQVDDLVRVRCGRILDRRDTEQRKQHDRQQGGDGDWYGLGGPPHGHEYADRRRRPARFGQAFGCARKNHCDGEQRAEEEADKLVPRTALVMLVSQV